MRGLCAGTFYHSVQFIRDLYLFSPETGTYSTLKITMKTRKEMSQRRSDQAPVTFCDVVACFSEEEWTLLHHWQKELYNNVMKEINQALSSLGPLIATSVFSLRPKEKEDEWLMEHEEWDIRGDVKAEQDVLFKKTRHENQNLKDFQDMNENENHYEPSDNQKELTTEGEHFFNSDNVLRIEDKLDLSCSDVCGAEEESSTCANSGMHAGPVATLSSIKKEGVSCSMDHLYPVRRESITSTKRYPFHSIEEEACLSDIHDTEREESNICTSSRPEDSIRISSIGINEEGETYPLDIQECGRRACINSIAGVVKATIRQSKDEDYVKYTQKSLPCKASIEKAKVKMTTASKMATNSRFQLLPETQGDIRGQKFSNCETSVGNKNHSNLCQEILRGEGSQKHNVCKSNLWKAQAYAGHTVTPKNWGPYPTLPASEEGLHQNFSFTEQQIEQDQISRENIHYQCKECDKSFSHKGHLICHERTHSRQRPYQCTECEKSFSQKHHLVGHQRTHLGGKPFQCTKCHKIFSWRESLHRHYKTHTGERPHHCVKCNKRFSRREGLIRHQKTHMNNNPPLIPPTGSAL